MKGFSLNEIERDNEEYCLRRVSSFQFNRDTVIPLIGILCFNSFARQAETFLDFKSIFNAILFLHYRFIIDDLCELVVSVPDCQA